MKKIQLILLLAAGMFIGGNAYADGTSGCGLGSQLLKGKSGAGMHLAAMIINGSFSQPTAMTIGTFGCDTSKSVQLHKQRETFVAVNHWNLAEDVSKGDGEYLVAYARVMGCDSAAQDLFAKKTQAAYNDIFTGQTMAGGVISATEQMIQNDAELSQHCKL